MVAYLDVCTRLWNSSDAAQCIVPPDIAQPVGSDRASSYVGCALPVQQLLLWRNDVGRSFNAITNLGT